MEDQAVAFPVKSYGSKRSRDGEDSPDAAAGRGGGWNKNKMPRRLEPERRSIPEQQQQQQALQPQNETVGDPEPPRSMELKPYPFFYYSDFSTEKDPDSLTPLTPPGRVPNFPAKMHSILSRPELADVICWMPHGRSWRILKPREFEIRVIPTYFEHAKLSSFIRQANGWGFRRITQGRDRNSYYHEQFLRGLPHLCKSMKRPGVAQKQAADPDHEPDLYKISEINPVPERAQDDSILLHCTLQGGPKARMPIYSGALKYNSANECVSSTKDVKMPSLASLSSVSTNKLTPSDMETLDSFQQSLGASEARMKNLSVSASPLALAPATVAPHAPVPSVPLYCTQPMSFGPQNLWTAHEMNPLAAASQLAFSSPPAAFTATTAASQFAAGFMAAATMNRQAYLQSFMMGAATAWNGGNFTGNDPNPN